ncbi:MAG: glycosyltransferase family 2 protein [Candidatus Nanohaloarchaea archaeon]
MLVLLAWLLIGSSIFMVTFFLNVTRHAPVDQEIEDKLEHEPSVSVLMPAYNEENVVEEAIEGTLDIDYENLSLIFVDDGSDDNTLEKAQKYVQNPKLEIIEHENNQGKGEALNTALEKAESDYIIVQDADSKISENLVRKAASRMEHNEDIAAVIASIKPLNDRNFFQKLQKIEYTLNNFYRNLMSHADILDVTPGAFSMYRTESVKEVGGFAEDNLTEDIEMAWRLRRNGASLDMCFFEGAKTEFPGSFRALYGQRVRWARGHIRNAWEKRDMFFNRQHGWFGLFQLPAQLTVAIFGILGFFLVLTGLGQALYSVGVQISATGLEIPSIALGNFYRALLNIPAVIYTPLAAGVGLSLYQLKLANERSDMKIRSVLSLLVYVFAFFMMKGFFWTTAVLKELTGRKKVWT